MPKKDDKILKYNHREEKYMKFSFIICADLESLLEKSSAIKINEHTPCAYSLFTHF